MDRFGIIIERQEQIEDLIREWGFLPFFKNGIKGFSIEEMTPPDILYGDSTEDLSNGPWGWKGPIISNWESAYGKFFRGKAGFVSLEWLPDFINWRRTLYPLRNQEKDARHILEVLIENESMLSKKLKIASGFTLSRKRNISNPDNPKENKRNGMAFDSFIAQLQMGTHVCIADFEYLISKKGKPYGWGVARYCTPEAMYSDIFPVKETIERRTPKQSRKLIIDHLCQVMPDVEQEQWEKLI